MYVLMHTLFTMEDSKSRNTNAQGKKTNRKNWKTLTCCENFFSIFLTEKNVLFAAHQKCLQKGFSFCVGEMLLKNILVIQYALYKHIFSRTLENYF